MNERTVNLIFRISFIVLAAIIVLLFVITLVARPPKIDNNFKTLSGTVWEGDNFRLSIDEKTDEMKIGGLLACDYNVSGEISGRHFNGTINFAANDITVETDGGEFLFYGDTEFSKHKCVIYVQQNGSDMLFDNKVIELELQTY